MPARPGSAWGSSSSEHIQNIVVDPRNSNVVYVTAIGPLWSSGGDRGLYKTTDGGQTWKAVLTHQRRHRRHRSADGSEESRRAVRRRLSAAPRRRPDDRRRPRERPLQVDRRRPDLDEAHQGAADRRTRPHRSRASTGENPQHGLRAGRPRSSVRAGSSDRTMPAPPGRGSATCRRRRARRPRRRPRRRAPHRRPCAPIDPALGPPSARPGRRQRGRGGAATTAIAAATPATTTRSTSTPTIRRRSGRCRPMSTAAPTAARPGRRCPMPGVHVDHHEIVFDPTDT